MYIRVQILYTRLNLKHKNLAIFNQSFTLLTHENTQLSYKSYGKHAQLTQLKDP